MNYKINHERVAVATDFYWQPISGCPVNCKVWLLGRGGVATEGTYSGVYDGSDSFFTDWAPLPKRRPTSED